MSTVDSATEFKQIIDDESRNGSELIRLTADLENHERVAAELAAQALEEGCSNLQELRSLFSTADAENKRAVAEFRTTVTARSAALKEIRDQLARLNAPVARG